MKQKTFYFRYVLLLLNILIIQISFAQLTTNNNQNNYRAVLWNSADGLSLGKKNMMLKDINGFLWLTSPVGLNRFDGSTFKIYYPEKNLPGAINGSYGFSLIEDSLHNIWIGTNKGLSRYDIKADTFKNFLPAFFSTESVASIIPFWAARDEVYCIEAGNHIVAYNIHSFEKKILISLGKNAPARNNDCIPQSIYDENSNSVWIMTGKHDVPGGGLLQVLLTEQKMIHHQWLCFKNIPHHAHFSYGMCYDPKRKSIWINSTDGLIAFTLSNKKFHEVPACSDLANTKGYESIAGIELDLQGKLWLCTNSKGIVIYDPLLQRVTPIFTDSTPSTKFLLITEPFTATAMVWSGAIISPQKGFIN